MRRIGQPIYRSLRLTREVCDANPTLLRACLSPRGIFERPTSAYDLSNARCVPNARGALFGASFRKTCSKGTNFSPALATSDTRCLILALRATSNSSQRVGDQTVKQEKIEVVELSD